MSDTAKPEGVQGEIISPALPAILLAHFRTLRLDRVAALDDEPEALEFGRQVGRRLGIIVSDTILSHPAPEHLELGLKKRYQRLLPFATWRDG